MSTNDQERASLSSARGVGSALGNAIPGIVGVEIIKHYGTENAQGYRVVGVACALIGFVVCLLHYYFTEERNQGSLGSSEENIKWSDVWVSLRKNPLFLALCIHGVCICAMQTMFNSVATYMYQDVYGNIKLMEMLYPASAPAMIIIFSLAPWLSKKIGLEKMIRYSLLFGGFVFVALFILIRITEINAVLFLILSSLAMGIPTVSIQMQWGLVAEAIDYNEVVLGKKTEGTIYGTFNLARRIGSGIGQGLLIKMLAWFNYDPELSAAGSVQGDFAVLGIQIGNALIPAIFVFGSWLAFKLIWKITPEIKQQIDAKKEAERILIEKNQ
jgi:Na+/melibiose symporter-like transporter